MKVFKFRPPYKSDGKTNFPESKHRVGVYLIKEDGKLVYVGYSGTNLYKTMYRHFQAWTDKQYRVSYVNKMKRYSYTVRIIYCTEQQAYQLESALIIKHKPRDNENKFDGFINGPPALRILENYQETIVQRDAPF